MNHSPCLNGPVAIWRFHRTFTSPPVCCSAAAVQAVAFQLLSAAWSDILSDWYHPGESRSPSWKLGLGAGVVDCGLPEEGLGPEVT